jgi:hypothetical protein
MVPLITSLLACSERVHEEPKPAEDSPLEARPVPPVLQYSGTSSGNAVFTEWEPGDLLYVGVDNANLRAAPGLDAPVVARLVLGEAVMVLQRPGRKTIVDDHRNSWYRVRVGGESGTLEGMIFGSVLTPVCAAADLDGYSSHAEITAASFTADFRPRIRVRDPGELDEERRTHGLELDIPGVDSGGVLSMSRLDNPAASWSLLAVTLCSEVDHCTVGLATYLNPSLGDDVLSAVPLEGLRLTPEDLDDIAMGRDWIRLPGQSESLYISQGRLQRQDCADCGGGVIVHPQPARPLLTHGDMTCSIFGVIDSGAYDNRETISCTSPGQQSAGRYVRLEGNTWAYITRSSTAEAEADALLEEGISVQSDSRTLLTGLTPVSILAEDATGRVRFDHHGTLSQEPERVVGTHPLLGAIFAISEHGEAGAHGDYAIPQADGGALIYRLEPNLKPLSWTIPAPPTSDYTAHRQDCDGELLPLQEALGVERADLTEVGSIAGQPLLSLKDPSHPVSLEAFASFRRSADASPAMQALARSPQDFAAALPLLIIKDPYGRFIQLLRRDLQPPCG